MTTKAKKAIPAGSGMIALTTEEARGLTGGKGQLPPPGMPIDWISPPVPPIIIELPPLPYE